MATRKLKGKETGHYRCECFNFCGSAGSASYPSRIDCSLASTLGFGAGLLIQNELTGLIVSCKNFIKEPTEWKVVGVPIIDLLQANEQGDLIHNPHSNLLQNSNLV